MLKLKYMSNKSQAKNSDAEATPRQSFFVPELGRSIESEDLADVETQVKALKLKIEEEGVGDADR